jgi:V8-like Glu-specific endopeptidase
MPTLTTSIPAGFSRVPDADVPPGCRICSLRIRTAGKTGLATGWVWGFHTIVTAGHVFDNVFSPQIDVLPGRNGPDAGKFLEFTTELFEPPTSLGDFAAIFVREPVGGGTGAFQLPLNPAASLKGAPVVLSGYRVADDAEEQLIGGGTVASDGGGIIRYTGLETVSGMSGSPVWIDGDATHVVAIHTNPNGVAQKITTSVAAKLQEWRAVEASRVSAAPVLLSKSALSLPGAAIAPFAIAASAVAPVPIAPAAGAYSDLHPVLRVADDIGAMIARAQPQLTRVSVQIRTQVTPWRPQPRADVLSLEEQSLVSALAARSPSVTVSCPQIVGQRVIEIHAAPSADRDPGSAILDVVLCFNTDETVGCATLLASDGVVLDSHLWPVAAQPSMAVAAPPATSSRKKRPSGKRRR